MNSKVFHLHFAVRKNLELGLRVSLSVYNEQMCVCLDVFEVDFCLRLFLFARQKFFANLNEFEQSTF